MENTDKYILRFYVALFGSVISHSIILLLIFALFPNLELEKKTIPFQLVSNDRKGQLSSTSQLSRSENTLAAQEFLRTLNASSFEELIRQNTQKSNQNKETHSPFKQSIPSDSFHFEQPIFKNNSDRANSFQGLQDIFGKKEIKQDSRAEIQQISSKTIEQLTPYEAKLLQKLAQKNLYDGFHPVMAKYKQTHIKYVITLHLFPNGAIKSANTRLSSNIPEIDHLAIKAAYSASPYPKPPAEDIKNGFLYHIPIIYQKTTTH